MATGGFTHKNRRNRFLLKLLVTILGVIVIEKALDAIGNRDVLGLALKPFHNNYFSYSDYYLTSHGLSWEFTTSPSATLRFIIYVIYGYLIFAFLNIPVFIIPALKKHTGKINSVLFNLVLISAFLLAFFFPHKVSIFDTGKKEIRVTNHKYLFIPVTEHIPFNSIDKMQYEFLPVYDGYDSQYIDLVIISAITKNDTRTELGEVQFRSQKGTLSHKPVLEVSQAVRSDAEMLVKLLDQKIR